MSKMDEQIIVVPRSALFNGVFVDEIPFQGVERDVDLIVKLMERISANYSVMRRGDAEENPEYKQPIPYVVVRKGNEIFLYKRLASGGEARLHDKLSIGVGGHMNISEHTTSFKKTLSENLLRELEEELNIESEEQEFTTIGLINDDNDDVGRVHIGLLVVLDLDEDATVSVRETDQLQGEWMNIEDILKGDIYDRLEPWSQFTVDVLK